MKRWILMSCLCMVFSLQAQQYAEPTTAWPYVLYDFSDARITFDSGEQSQVKVNIHLLHNHLHYLKGDRVFVPNMPEAVTRIQFEETAFVPAEGFFIEVYQEAPGLVFGLQRKGNYEALTKSNGAYGTQTSTGAAQNYLSVPLGGINNLDYLAIKNDRDQASAFPVDKRLVFVVDGEIVSASQKKVAKLLPESQQDAFKQFVKSEKINWRKRDSLEKVFRYLVEHRGN